MKSSHLSRLCVFLEAELIYDSFSVSLSLRVILKTFHDSLIVDADKDAHDNYPCSQNLLRKIVENCHFDNAPF